MNYLYEALDKPTRLYIKQCPHCGLKYFGKTIVEDIENYSGSGVYWTRHLEKHGVEPVHLWNSNWYYDTKIKRFASKFSKINRIVESKLWANLAIENGIEGGYLGEKIVEKMKSTKNDPMWKETVGKEATQKRMQKINYIEIAEKVSNTCADPVWKETIGKQRDEKRSATMGDLQWKETVGKKSRSKYSNTVNDPNWLETKGKERSKKQSERAKNREKKICPHCGKTAQGSNFTRWHGDNCKLKA